MSSIYRGGQLTFDKLLWLSIFIVVILYYYILPAHTLVYGGGCRLREGERDSSGTINCQYH